MGLIRAQPVCLQHEAAVSTIEEIIAGKHFLIALIIIWYINAMLQTVDHCMFNVSQYLRTRAYTKVVNSATYVLCANNCMVIEA